MSPPPLYTLTGAAKIAVETSVRRKRRTVLKIRLNTNGWDETQPLNGVSCKRRRGRSRDPTTRPLAGGASGCALATAVLLQIGYILGVVVRVWAGRYLKRPKNPRYQPSKSKPVSF